MPIPLYLALTAGEISQCTALPEKLAWLSCHFSSDGRGLRNLPKKLPAGSLLILDDQTFPAEQDISLLRQQLFRCIETNRCCGLLLDFQRPNHPETAKIAADLISLPCPVCVSHLYARELTCPVFLPPCPLTVPLSAHLEPWMGRTVWLDAALDSACFTVTEQGCERTPCPTDGSFPFHDEKLHCHYRMELTGDSAQFFLNRNSDDLDAILGEAAALGVSQAVGLWQEFN